MLAKLYLQKGQKLQQRLLAEFAKQLRSGAMECALIARHFVGTADRSLMLARAPQGARRLKSWNLLCTSIVTKLTQCKANTAWWKVVVRREWKREGPDVL